ncbi:hypothetical protein OJAV_G00085780 [Oryzias javanicus]|uniref:Uncharacterized protein n=1 Tax=Oryzias javanicus TaxID=123683 RepID=A0A437CYX5_ORYJA|nr:hypothetical protein OJAV_G00085780 [Oryzias javanicus]
MNEGDGGPEPKITTFSSEPGRDPGMELYQKASMRKLRRNSNSLLQHLIYRGVHGGGRDTPIPAQPRDANMIQSIASLIRAKSKLLLLENPDTVEIYKLDEPTAGPGKGHFYLPAIPPKASGLSSVRGALTQSCPYLYDKRRGSLSSVRVSPNRRSHRETAEPLKSKKGKLRNPMWTVTMTYPGPEPSRVKLGGQEELLQTTWLAGGTPCYRCTSLRHKSSSCQQLNNGTKENLILPLEQKTGNGAVDSCPSSPLFIPAKPVKKSAKKHIKESVGASTDSEDLAVAGTTATAERKRRRGQTHQRGSKDKAAGCKEGGRGQERRDSERSPMTEKSGEKTRTRKQLKTAGNAAAQLTEEKQKTTASLQDDEGLTKKNKEAESEGKNRDGERRRDFYEECVEMSAALRRGPNKHRFKESILERCRLQKSLSSSPKAQSSDVELSAESDNSVQADEEREEEEEEEDAARHGENKEEPVKEQDLEAQLDAMMTVLKASDEVEQLVLRNTGLTDDLLLSLATVLKGSPSQVKMLNLNLNTIGPYGAHILLEVLRVKPHVKGLHLFGNRLRDHGLLTLLTGVAELQEQTAAAAAASVHHALLFPSGQDAMLQLPTGWSSFEVFTLLELDVGGNGLNSDGVRVMASYLRSHSHLQYLGLAQTSSADLAAWKELFESLRGNGTLAHIILDENNLGDPGVRLLADMLKENASLRRVDLDGNDISDVGGNDIMGALLCRTDFPLSHLSLEENSISAGLMSRIQEQVKASCRG